MWDYKVEESKFAEIPEGRYRVCIETAEMATSKAGNEMLKMRLIISGTNNRRLYHHIVFLPDRPEITNRMLTQFFDAFEIERGDFSIAGYVGRMGGAQVKHDEEGRARIQYFLAPSVTAKLPPYDGDIPTTATTDNIPFDNADDLPF